MAEWLACGYGYLRGPTSSPVTTTELQMPTGAAGWKKLLGVQYVFGKTNYEDPKIISQEYLPNKLFGSQYKFPRIHHNIIVHPVV